MPLQGPQWIPGSLERHDADDVDDAEKISQLECDSKSVSNHSKLCPRNFLRQI